MDKHLDFGEIVLIKFPFSDGKSFKKRPALVIADFDDQDIIVCRITSQLYGTKNDASIENWQSSGLKLPSIIRVHKMATLEKNMADLIMGKINSKVKSEVKEIIQSFVK